MNRLSVSGSLVFALLIASTTSSAETPESPAKFSSNGLGISLVSQETQDLRLDYIARWFQSYATLISYSVDDSREDDQGDSVDGWPMEKLLVRAQVPGTGTPGSLMAFGVGVMSFHNDADAHKKSKLRTIPFMSFGATVPIMQTVSIGVEAELRVPIYNNNLTYQGQPIGLFSVGPVVGGTLF